MTDADLSERWDEDLRPAISWLLVGATDCAASLPPPPGTTISNQGKYLDALIHDLQEGPRGPRGRVVPTTLVHISQTCSSRIAAHAVETLRCRVAACRETRELEAVAADGGQLAALGYLSREQAAPVVQAWRDRWAVVTEFEITEGVLRPPTEQSLPVTPDQGDLMRTTGTVK